MTIFKHLWRYWVWLCVSGCTTFAVLLLLAAAINHFKPAAPTHENPATCLDSGGAWDDAAKTCVRAG